jgi:general secretion pathway protein H
LTDQCGFTLIELAIVVVLLGLVAGLTLPLLGNWGQDDLPGSARRLAGTVRFLYNEAALTRNEHQLIFNLDDGSYQTKGRPWRRRRCSPIWSTCRGWATSAS